jgi:hypothetical protein
MDNVLFLEGVEHPHSYALTVVWGRYEHGSSVHCNSMGSYHARVGRFEFTKALHVTSQLHSTKEKVFCE